MLAIRSILTRAPVGGVTARKCIRPAKADYILLMQFSRFVISGGKLTNNVDLSANLLLVTVCLWFALSILYYNITGDAFSQFVRIDGDPIILIGAGILVCANFLAAHQIFKHIALRSSRNVFTVVFENNKLLHP